MNLLEQLKRSTVLADGAMGTMLHSRGIGFEKCFDELNLTNPAAVAAIHREYISRRANHPNEHLWRESIQVEQARIRNTNH